MKNTVIITRKYDKNQTYGTLVARRGNKVFTCKTLELKWNNNMRNASCIPEGVYTAAYTYWPAKKRYNYLLAGIPGRSGVFIHSGNYAFKKTGKADITGCILLGVSYNDLNGDGVLDITTTVVTIDAFQKFMNKEPFELVVKKMV